MANVVVVTGRREIAPLLALREAVLVGERGLDPTVARDEADADPTTVHVAVYGPEGACVGAGRLVAPVDHEENGELVEGNPVIGPIVVAPSARGGGVARAILARLEAEALALFGNNGTVTVEAWIPEGANEDAARLGYGVDGDDARGPAPWPARAFRELAAS